MRITFERFVVFCTFCLCAGSALLLPRFGFAACPSGYSQRLTIINNCYDGVYAIITPPADTDSIGLWANIGDVTEIYQDGVNADSGTRYKLAIPNTGSTDLCIPDAGIPSGNFRFYVGCDGPGPDKGYPTNCKIGAAPGSVPFGVDTLFEFSGGCSPANTLAGTCTANPSDGTPLDQPDYFDLSDVSGYTIPMSLEVVANSQGQTASDLQCSFSKMVANNDLESCPNETKATISTTNYANSQLDGNGISLKLTDNGNTIACMSPEQWVEPPGGQNPQNLLPIALSPGISSDTPNVADWYACNVKASATADNHPLTCLTPGCGGPQCAIGPDGTAGDYSMANLASGKGKPYTNYVKMLKATGNQAYAWQFNDDASTLKCTTWGAKVQLTLCPGTSGQRPYQNQNWSFSNGECNVDSQGTYDTLVACQRENLGFLCTNEVVQKLDASDASVIVSATLNYCMPVNPNTATPAELAKAVSWEECEKSSCQSKGIINLAVSQTLPASIYTIILDENTSN